VPIVDVMNVRLVSVAPGATVRQAIARMLEENVGSVAVCDGARLVGIFTERDVLRLAGDGTAPDELRVGDVMTTNLVTVSADDDILSAAHLMSERRIRHLPVVQGDNLLGVVGIRDVLGALTERVWSAQDPQARETVHELLDELPKSR
jgi:CBS domain-containing protein